MRACVLIAAPLLAMIAALPACRANPGFMLRDDGGDADSTGADTTGDTSASGASTGAELCEPVNTESGALCTPEFDLLPITKAIVNFSNAAILRDTRNVCDAFDGFLVKRVGDELQRCDDGCDAPCDPDTAMDVSILVTAPNFNKLLPSPDACATLWHISRPNPEPMPPEPDGEWTPCVTSGFLLMDDTPERQLRVAVTFDSDVPDPFADQPDSPLTMVARTDAPFDLCTGQISDTCLDGFTPLGLTFGLGRCSVETYQSLTTTALSTATGDYILELHNAYRCIDNRQNYRWWVRRQF